MTYWQKYQYDNPYNAEQILALGLNFSSLPDSEVREKCYALESFANYVKCSIADLKGKILAVINRIEEPYLLYLIDQYEEKKIPEASRCNISPDNTFFAIAQDWIWERVEEVELKYSHIPPITSLDLPQLLPKFGLDGQNMLLIKKKIHIYTKSFPRPQRDKDYVKIIEQLLDTYFERYVGPFASNEELRKNPSLFNMMLPAHVFKYWLKLSDKDDEIKDLFNIDAIIEECNGHNVSFYLEMDFAQDRIINKYKM